MTDDLTDEEIEQLPTLRVAYRGSDVIIRGNGPLDEQMAHRVLSKYRGEIADDNTMKDIVEDLNENGYREYRYEPELYNDVQNGRISDLDDYDVVTLG